MLQLIFDIHVPVPLSQPIFNNQNIFNLQILSDADIRYLKESAQYIGYPLCHASLVNSDQYPVQLQHVRLCACACMSEIRKVLKMWTPIINKTTQLLEKARGHHASNINHPFLLNFDSSETFYEEVSKSKFCHIMQKLAKRQDTKISAKKENIRT